MILEELTTIFTPLVGIGFFLGCIPLIFGLGVQAVINIFKKI